MMILQVTVCLTYAEASRAGVDIDVASSAFASANLTNIYAVTILRYGV